MEKYLHLLNKDYVYKIPANQKISVEEKSNTGKGKCHFISKDDVLFIKPRDNRSFIWLLQNQKCADAAFISFSSNGQKILHIIEMKSNVTRKEFKKVIDQCKGMYLSSLSIMSILKLSEPDEIKIYIAYKEDNVIQNKHQMLIKNKVLVGKPKEELDPITKSWLECSITLDHNNLVLLIKKERIKENNNEYNCDFGRI